MTGSTGRPPARRSSVFSDTKWVCNFDPDVWQELDWRAADEDNRETGSIVRDLIEAYGQIDPEAEGYVWLPPRGHRTLIEAYGGRESDQSGRATRKIFVSSSALRAAMRRAMIEVEPLEISAPDIASRMTLRSLPTNAALEERGSRCLAIVIRVLCAAYAEGRITSHRRPPLAQAAA